MEGGRRLHPREVLRGLRRTSDGSHVISSIPSGKGNRFFSTNLRKMALPTAITHHKRHVKATATAAIAAMTAAVTATIMLGSRGSDDSSGGTPYVSNSKKSGWTNLLTRPAVSCAYRRRIQDMYRLVDNPVGQGAQGNTYHILFEAGAFNVGRFDTAGTTNWLYIAQVRVCTYVQASFVQSAAPAPRYKAYVWESKRTTYLTSSLFYCVYLRVLRCLCALIWIRCRLHVLESPEFTVGTISSTRRLCTT